MLHATSQFNGRRLAQAREYRQMTGLNLAFLCDVVSSTVSKWENENIEPRSQHLDKLSEILKFDRMFFFRPSDGDEGLDFWRSQSQATISARNRAKSRLSWLKELSSYAWQFFETPALNLPRVDVPKDFEELDDDSIETIARNVRAYWNLPEGPLGNVVRTLEKNGIIVSRCDLLADKLDALSEFKRYPFVMLGSRKASAVRSRFDACHELGHIIMHRNVQRRDLNNAAKFKRIEDQAHLFAASLLLPAEYFLKELWAPSLEALRERKEEWGVSIACMLRRCLQLELISDTQYRLLNVQISKRQWRNKEPLDNILAPEHPRLLAKCFESLVQSGTKTPQQILRELRLPANEIEELCGLAQGFFGQTTPADILEITPLAQNEPTLPPDPNQIEFSNILQFKVPNKPA